VKNQVRLYQNLFSPKKASAHASRAKPAHLFSEEKFREGSLINSEKETRRSDSKWSVERGVGTANFRLAFRENRFLVMARRSTTRSFLKARQRRCHFRNHRTQWRSLNKIGKSQKKPRK
jgi:hypothetical protein